MSVVLKEVRSMKNIMIQNGGVPIFEDQKLFEFLTLETFQAGLSWITILKKRENFSLAFDQFDYQKIASYGPKRISFVKKRYWNNTKSF